MAEWLLDFIIAALQLGSGFLILVVGVELSIMGWQLIRRDRSVSK